jgi:hypothetical protein
MTSSYISMHTNCTPTYPSPWKEELETIAKKHDNGKPFNNSDQLTPGFCDEVLAFSERFLAWLEKEYAPECSTFERTYKHWTGVLPQPREKSFRGWFADETSPTPHGGWPGATWYFETSLQGRACKTLPQLKIAYQRCEELRQKRMEEERIAKERQDTEDALRQAFWLAKEKTRLKRAEEERFAKEKQDAAIRSARMLIIADEKIRQEEAQIREEKYARYKRLLSNSLQMRHYASYVKDGEIYPESWEPGFSMDIKRQMIRELGTAAVDKVISEFQRNPEMTRRIETLQREWKEAKIREKKEEEDRKAHEKYEEEERNAELLARAIVREQERLKASAPKEEQKSFLHKLFNPFSSSSST